MTDVWQPTKKYITRELCIVTGGSLPLCYSLIHIDFAEAKGYILWFLADRQSRLLFWTIALRILVQNNKNDSQNVSGLFYTTIISKLLIIVNLHVNALLLLYGFLTPLLLYSTVKS